ncbi:MAG: SRPBCC family protein [Polyangiaceae bacterium]
MPSFDLEQRFDAPADIVWDVLTDHRGYETWGAAKSATLEAEGSPDVNGVGAVRRLSSGPLVIREKVLEFEPKTRFVYTVLSGPPVRDYRATVTLDGRGAYTMVHWTVGFRGKLPLVGHLLKPVVRGVIRGLMQKASVESARRGR